MDKPRNGDEIVEARHLRVVDADDPWLVEGHSYDQRRFYTRSVDERGHKEVFHVPFPPQIYGRIAELVSSKEIKEYRSPQDLIRDAVVHRLHVIGEMTRNGDLIRAVAVEQMLSDQYQMMMEMEELEKSISNTEALLGKAAQLGDMGMLEVMIERAEKVVDEVREPYKGKLVGIIKDYRRKLVEGSRNGEM